MTRRPILVVCFAFLLAVCGSAADWESIHQEMFGDIVTVTNQYFGQDGETETGRSLQVPFPAAEHSSLPSIIVVGFTGGLQRADSNASGVAVLRSSLQAHMSGQMAVSPITFNNLRWRRAVAQVLGAVHAGREQAGSWLEARQPLIIVYGHSWGAGAIGKFASALKKEDVEISLALYIDSISWRNPRVPDNVRFAVNLYQRSGILRGFPLRGKGTLIPEDGGLTHVVGSYRIRPQTSIGRWSWNIFKPLLYKQHHRIAHDPRLEMYLMELLSRNLALLDRAMSEPGG